MAEVGGLESNPGQLGADASREVETVLPRVVRGDPEAMDACLDRFGGLVWSLARKLSRSMADAEDAVQEIFLDVWKSAPRYDPTIASETAFVAMIARRRLIDRQRRQGRRPQEEMLVEDARTSGPPESGEDSSRAEDVLRADAAFQRLSVEQQKVLRLAIHQGLSHDKIAKATGLPLGTVKTHARRGLIKLRELMGVAPASREEVRE
ncbi:MAG: sigma-70 family RNA polymerase sigma factor [Phycisphaeraceae bacterium]|nr:sigma-70 family RNA polymerase sigma factor [Phycisphaeraceae bacterium]MCW5754692.1 sigma-70 family RNA polymerase sigma factor [Phycisphaeraceae bacterium]